MPPKGESPPQGHDLLKICHKEDVPNIEIFLQTLESDLKQIQAERDSIWHKRKRTIGFNRNLFKK